MSDQFFSTLLDELSLRAARATVNRLGFSSPELRTHLMEVFTQEHGQPGSFLGDPVFEATFGWQTDPSTMEELSPSLLSPDLVQAMDVPLDGKNSPHRFPKTAKPYRHQVAAWRALLQKDPQSVVVTSGTGSGKTECFMVPILSKLASERNKDTMPEGVRALFLYPLNALIQSQRERLRAWTAPFGKDIRFCLYNGMTPDKAKAGRQNETPNEVLDRTTLRASPPSILVTNPTMLEYMLVRAQDAPILEKSQGKLQWVVLDEAHNYIGSQAAELALLLRRVLHAFGVNADQVRFVATSATIGGDKDTAAAQLKIYLSKLAGVSPDRVCVIEGFRHIDELQEVIEGGESVFPTTRDEDLTDAQLYARLATAPLGRELRNMFVPTNGGRPFQLLSAVRERLSSQLGQCSNDAALKWLDLATSARTEAQSGGKSFLPLRMHVFHNTLNGIWACADRACPEKTGSALDHPDWLYGRTYLEERQHCKCGAPVYPIVSCNDCNSAFLLADIANADGVARLLPPTTEDPDEFLLDVEVGESDGQGQDDGATSNEGGTRDARSPVLVANGRHIAVTPYCIEVTSRIVLSGANSEGLAVDICDRQWENEEWVLQCPDCKGGAPHDTQFRHPKLGAPFLLGTIVPTLLEFCPDGDSPLDSPLRGRRMITFTDSRQGTARLAAKLQQDSERNSIRSAVYQRVARATNGLDSPESAKLREDIKNLELVEKSLSANPDMASLIRDQRVAKERELSLQSAPKSFRFNEMAQWLASQVPDVSRWMHDYYSHQDAHFKVSRGKELLAEILLMREFARRPKRVNSLETLGLVSVQYPKLDKITSRLPAVEAAGLTLQEWHAFLKLSLDFFIRENTFIDLPDSWRKWGGNRIFPKQLLPSTSIEKTTSQLKKWPKCRTNRGQPRLVRILAYVLKLDPLSPIGQDRIDSLLSAAWVDLTTRSDILQQGALGRYLALEDMSFQIISEGWICPVTRRILDVTLRGVTPYLPREDVHEGVALCRPISIPTCELLREDFDSSKEKVAAVRAWVNTQPAIAQARQDGLWSDLNDRILEGGAFFRSVEHSAQQAGSKLAVYEDLFRKGKINLMSCSTTMEMGVDIGGINTVAMNNVPPHPANYLQRAGRAGRRGESRSVALTVCKNNPHDQHVFQNTLWPFITKLPAPSITLSSPLLVQRHINALMLSDFLRRLDKSGDLNKLTLEWWMVPRGESRQEKFVAWCECFDPAQEPRLNNGLRSLIKHTPFDGRPSLTSLANEVAAHSKLHTDSWLLELHAIDEQIKEFTGKKAEGDPAMRALQIQRARLTGEYLLRELASSGFLPGYGFPTDITSFETLNRDALSAISRERETPGREDNRFQRRELPSRDSVTALREYAPGASVVIDGLVYESAGITLNWHAPATVQDIAEIQNIRQAWRCGNCGSSGTSVSANTLELCSECGHKLNKDSQRHLIYLEPAGYSVDIYAPTHNDVSIQTYVPVENPWISSHGDWIPLPNPALGRFRTTTQGSVFHYSSGSGGLGYAVCLECGRAAPMGAEPDGNVTPKVFRRPHKRLRGSQGEDKICAGSENEFKIKKNLRFGREHVTDVFEIVLHGVDGLPLADRVAAYTIAVAIRRVIASHLGVDEAELGCDAKSIRLEGERRSCVIQVYDIRSAGYSSMVGADIVEMLKKVPGILDCDHTCDSVCQHCLLTFDTRYRLDDLDRNVALEFLSAKWLDSLALQEADRHFGASSKAEFQPLMEAIVREVNSGETIQAIIYLNADIGSWDMPTSPIRRLLHRISSTSSAQLSVVLPPNLASDLPWDSTLILSALRDLCAVSIFEGKAPTVRNNAYCAASVQSRDGAWQSWATVDELATTPSASWGRISDYPLVAGLSDAPTLSAPIVLRTNEDAGRPTSGVARIEITNEIDGAVNGFGERLLTQILPLIPSSFYSESAEACAVQYEDRYLVTPLAVALLVEFTSALKSNFSRTGKGNIDRITVITCPINDAGRRVANPTQFNQDWLPGGCREDGIGAAFTYCGIESDIRILPKNQTLHSRLLTVSWTNGKTLRIWFDQGLSYWALKWQRGSPYMDFAFTSTAAAQGEMIAECKVDIHGHSLPTQIFVGVEIPT